MLNNILMNIPLFESSSDDDNEVEIRRIIRRPKKIRVRYVGTVPT